MVFRFYGSYDGFAYARNAQQPGFDFAQFNPVSPNLHLMVDPSQMLQPSVRQPARQIAGSVQPLPGNERIVHKFLGRQFRTRPISAGDSRAADAQLS
ncbi:hypothetical protein PMJ11TS3_45960 [Paenibacillus melissococcoides]